MKNAVYLLLAAGGVGAACFLAVSFPRSGHPAPAAVSPGEPAAVAASVPTSDDVQAAKLSAAAAYMTAYAAAADANAAAMAASQGNGAAPTIPANTTVTYALTDQNDVRTICTIRRAGGRDSYSITKYADATVDIDSATTAQWVHFGCAARVAQVRYDNSPEGKAKIEARIVRKFNEGLFPSAEQSDRKIDQLLDDIRHPAEAWRRDHCGADGDQPDDLSCREKPASTQ